MRVRLLSGLEKITPYTAIFMLFILIYLILHNWSRWREEHSDSMTCDAIINIYKGKQRLSLRLQYAFLGEEGTVNLSGALEMEGEKATQINRQVFFNYIRVNDGVYLENKKTAISLLDNSGPNGLDSLLPAFYTHQGGRANFLVYAQKPGGYIFVKDFIPAFYCAEK
ncbi:hypothetical protein [Klebsiella aerogenes]|uniref:hypothetical protein n=1 Tax=Klebsiella aerogenes TaxID=548 RepID=UPI000AC6AADD|nr:hypothetical protein [Klebsiella aerogenes]